MLFNLTLINTDNSLDVLLVSASTWSNLFSYAEGTGKNINSMGEITLSNLMLNNTSLFYSYNVNLTNTVTKLNSYYIIYDTFDNVITWVNQQSDVYINGLNYQKRQFVSI